MFSIPICFNALGARWRRHGHAFRAALPNSAADAIERFLRSPFSLVLAVVLAFALNAHSLPLTDVDEGAFSEATREMMARGNLVSPMLNEVPRHDKPILIYWAQAISVSLLGVSELGFRAPSIVFAILWLWAIHRFCRRHADASTAQVAALAMGLSLMVGLVARAAIADALLNLCLTLGMFGIYEVFRAERNARPATELRRWYVLTYAMLGLGFLVKGPVAVFFPLLVSVLFFASAGALPAWWRACTFWPGWLLFLAIVLPWHVAVYVDQGDAFFRGFYLKHNVDRYASTFEGHGGRWYYYLVVLPPMLMPFTGWLMMLGRQCFKRREGAFALPEADRLLERFLWLWFATVFAFFSLSGTQLPHYLLYGSTPLFILMARYRPEANGRWLVYLPVLAFALLLLGLPEVLQFAATRTQAVFEQSLLGGLEATFADRGQGGFAFLCFAVLLVALWRRLPIWQGVLLVGLLQAWVIADLVAPRLLAVTQEPIRQAAHIARKQGASVVSWGVAWPSFSVYRQAATPTRLPKAGEWVLTRSDRVDGLQARLPEGWVLRERYRNGVVVMLQADRGG